MSIDNLSKAMVEDNEEMLLTDIASVKVDATLCEEFICGIDCGSTQTRIVMMPSKLAGEEDIANWFDIHAVIPSKSKVVPEDLTLKPRSNVLYDNLDSSFSINGNQEIRLVRGSKFYDVELAEKELIASTKKVTSDVLRFNIVDAIGFNLVQHYTKIKQDIPGQVICELSIALPPDDLMERDLDQLKSNLKRFTWCLPGRTDFIEVRLTKFAAYSEPEAQIKAHYTFSDIEPPEEVLLLETGGRNSAPVIFLNGAPIGTGLKSIDQSGSKLLDKIGLGYINQYGGSVPALRHLEHAVRTGLIKSGNTYIDITDIIKQCKDEVAEDLFQKLQSAVLSKQTVVHLESLNAVLLSGRVYKSGDYNYSVADRLKVLINTISQHTEVSVLGENLIPQGLVISYLLDNVYNM